MEKVRLGRSDLEVSRIGLGCMGMSSFYKDAAGAGARSEAERETESLHVISEALDVLGLNFFDTADLYGENELLLAKALALRPRSSYVLATKFGAVGGAAPQRVHECCKRSLARLQQPYVDLYYLHRVDPTQRIEDVFAEMSKLVAEGKTRYLGISEANPATLRRAHAVHPLAALQSELSIWTPEVARESLPVCRELGISFVAYSPLGRGFLAGCSPADLSSDDWRNMAPRFQRGSAEHNKVIADIVAAVAQRKGATAAQVALAWTLRQGKDVVPIPGTTRVARLHENAGALNVELSDADVRDIEDVVQSVGVAGQRYPPERMASVQL